MNYNFLDTRVGVISGLAGGSTKFICEIIDPLHPSPFGMILLKAGVIAVISAICGVAGKDIYLFFKRKIKQW